MRIDALVHRYNVATGHLRTVQIPYAIPELCPDDPEIVRLRRMADAQVILATHDWVWAEAELGTIPIDQQPVFPASGPVAVRYLVPETGQEIGVWCENAVLIPDADGRPRVYHAMTGHPCGLFKAPVEALGRPAQLGAAA